MYQPNDTLLHKYRIDALIGQGAFAHVYRATHLTLHAPRALKALRRDAPGLGSTEYGDFRARFKLEAQLGAALEHCPHVINVFDFEQDGDTLIVVMEFAPGGSLADRLAQLKKENQLMPVAEAMRLAREAAQGLAALHELDAVHRDVKPSNLLFDAQGHLKLSDLGLAQMSGGPSQRSLAGSRALPHPGTPAYMSPEQQKTTDYLTPASDVYSLGLALFEMLTGRAYKNLKPGTRLSQKRADAPAWLDELVAQMLSDDASARPWDGRELASALEAGERAAEEARQAELKRQQEEDQRKKKAAEQAARKAAAKAEAARQAEIKRRQEVAEAAQRAAEQRAQDACSLGQSYCQIGFYDLALEQFAEAIELDPQRADYWFERGKSYSWKDLHCQAIADFTQAIALDDTQGDYWFERGKSYYNLRFYRGNGDYNLAIADFTQAITLNPKEADYWFERGKSYYEKGEYAQAWAELSVAIGLNANQADYWFERGKSYAGNDLYGEAITDFDQAITLDDTRADYWYERGKSHYYRRFYQGEGDYNRAIADYSKAIELDPQNPDYWFERGKSYDWKGDHDGAIADYSKAIELNPQNPDYWSERGKSYDWMFDYDEAIADYSKAIELDPQNADYWHSRSLTYQAKGDATRAAADETRAHELGYTA